MIFSPRHILVTGSHRSGTTWVGKTICQHAGVSYVHEPFNIDYPNQQIPLDLDTWFTDAATSAQQAQIRRAFDNHLRPMHRLIRDTRRCASRQGLSRLGACAAAGIGQLLTAERVLVKDPIAIYSAGWLHDRYGMQVICMIRNPHAFVGSLKTAGWDFDFDHIARQHQLVRERLAPYAGQISLRANPEHGGTFIERACLIWNVIHAAILAYRHTRPDWLFVTQESLALDPAKGFGEIFDFLGLELTPDIAAYIAAFTSTENPGESGTTDYGPRDARKSLETWRSRLTPEEIATIDELTGEIAGQFYAAAG